MAKIYPETFTKKLPKGFFKEDLLTKKNLSLRIKASQALILTTDVSKEDLQNTVLKVSNFYKNKIDDLKEEGLPKAKAEFLATNGEALLKQRIENLVVFAGVQTIKENNEGEYYRWLASSSSNPDPQHQLLYGKVFKVGEGDDEGNMPMERYGCNCGMEILATEKA